MYSENNGHGINDPRSAQEYLNEISAKPATQPFLNKKMMMLIGGALVLILIVVIVAISLAGNSGGLQERMATLRDEYATVLGVADYGNKNLPGGELLRTNAEAALVLGTQSVKIASYAPTSSSRSSSSSRTPTELSTLTTSLDSAKNSGRLSEVFLDTLSRKIDSLITGLNGILSLKPSEEVKNLATLYIEQLRTVKERL